MMVYSSDYEADLLSIKHLLERYNTASGKSQREDAAPPELFDPITPPKPRAPDTVVGEEAKPRVVVSRRDAKAVAEPPGGGGVPEAPATAIRKPRAGLKGAEKVRGATELVVKGRKGKDTISEGVRSKKGAAKKNMGGCASRGAEDVAVISRREEGSSATASSAASSDSDFGEQYTDRTQSRKPCATARRSRRIVIDSEDESAQSEEAEPLTVKKLQRLTIDLTLSDSEEDLPPRKPIVAARRGGVASEDDSFESQDSKSSFKIPAEAILSYSPPRSTKPSKVLKPADPAPLSTLPNLASPTKRVPKIPPTPHRLSSDLFWDQGETNAWIDAHSPQKKPGVQRTLFESSEKSAAEEEPHPPPPTKGLSKEQRAARKAFDAKKKALAEEFLKMVDDKIGKGEVGRKCADTCGVQIVWSKTLRTTAGTAKWRANRHVGSEGQTQLTRHRAVIQLSEKVVDCEEKLYNVICHEYCHLANYIIDSIYKPPHGPEFKRWALLCTKAFQHLGVVVTTTHSYEIQCKYQWACQSPGCGYIYRRHSPSIDPIKHRCGSCSGGTLIQTHPPPKEKRAITGYQAFVKNNFSRIKAENPGTPQKAVMSIVAREYKEFKAGSEAEKGKEVPAGRGFVQGGEKEGELEALLVGLKV